MDNLQAANAACLRHACLSCVPFSVILAKVKPILGATSFRSTAVSIHSAPSKFFKEESHISKKNPYGAHLEDPLHFSALCFVIFINLTQSSAFLQNTAFTALQMDPSYYGNLPAGVPPPGVVPNLDDPQSRAIDAYIGMGICIGITSVLVLLRVYVKLAITHLWGWDDCEFFDMISHSTLTFVGACLMGFVSRGPRHPISYSLMMAMLGPNRRARCRVFYP